MFSGSLLQCTSNFENESEDMGIYTLLILCSLGTISDNFAHFPFPAPILLPYNPPFFLQLVPTLLLTSLVSCRALFISSTTHQISRRSRADFLFFFSRRTAELWLVKMLLGGIDSSYVRILGPSALAKCVSSQEIELTTFFLNFTGQDRRTLNALRGSISLKP